MSTHKVVVLGAGESGVGAALLAQHLGFDVFVSDKGNIKQHYTTELERNGIPYEEAQHTRENITQADEVIKSPGIPDTVPLIVELREMGIPVISEIEFAARYTDAFLVGITGSNGKTTTTKLTNHLLQSLDSEVGMGGNVGYSFARLVLENRYDLIVLELSSFQLDGIEDFRPDIALLLNITPDHLDRYEYKMENYVRSKFRIVRNQRGSDVFLYKADDPEIQNHLNQLATLPMKQIPIPAHTGRGLLHVGEYSFDLSQTALKGGHNYFNAHCAIQVALMKGVQPAQIQSALESFVNEPHRMEYIRTLDEVEYFNDSKATNVDSVFQALKAMDRPTIWIAGGIDKGNDYEVLFDVVKEKVKALICLGKDNEKLVSTFQNRVDEVIETQSAEDAANAAQKLAEAGDVVILSPACSSFDLFNNYIHRGDLFREAVKGLE